MALQIVKETIEITNWTTDAQGNAYFTKRINLKSGFRHQLLQVDLFEDVYPPFSASFQPEFEVVISPYPAIPTDMQFRTTGGVITNRYPSAGDESVLFKAIGDVRSANSTVFSQFPSTEIAANNFTAFYTDHVYINIHWMSEADTSYTNFGMSFMMVFDDKKVPVLEHSIGILQESHNAMCALIMSNGRLNTISNLRGNTFPMWRYGGIRPEHTISATATNSFFLEIDTRDAEAMADTAQIRQAVADARAMSSFDSAFGDRRPDWMSMDLNQGIIAGPIRSDPIPLKYADNGNTRMF